MSSGIDALTMTVSISEFNRGKAGQIFESVRRTGSKVVMKNNTPEVVLVSPEDYVRLKDEMEDLQDLLMAQERLSHFDPAKLIPGDEFDKMFGITPKDLEGFEEVEFE